MNTPWVEVIGVTQKVINVVINKEIVMTDARLVQAFFPGYPRPIQAVQFSDGPRGATVRSLCKFASLAYAAQSHRIRRTPGLKDAIRTITLNTPGGRQATDVLLDWGISIWASGLQTTRLSKEKQAVASILKEEAFAAIERAFTQPEQDDPPIRPAQTPANAVGKLRQAFSLLLESQDVKQAIALLVEGFSLLEIERQEEQARVEEQARKHQALAGRVGGMEEWLTSLDRHVAASGQGSAADSGWRPMLSAAHLADLAALFRSLEQATGRTQAQLAQELSKTFHMAAINAIPDELWPDVLDWYCWRVRQPR